MSAVLSLTEANRTWRGRPISVENDPYATSASTDSLVEPYRPVCINDPNTFRIMPAIVYPSHSRPQRASDGLCPK